MKKSRKKSFTSKKKRALLRGDRNVGKWEGQLFRSAENSYPSREAGKK
jgi:hypothetical protein